MQARGKFETHSIDAVKRAAGEVGERLTAHLEDVPIIARQQGAHSDIRMTPRQIRLGFVALGVITGSVALNLFALQPNDGRQVRPERAYRGLDALPGTASTSISDRNGGGNAVDAAGDAGPAPAKVVAPQAGKALVRSIQRGLAERGLHPGESDGTIDVVTRAAILDFEDAFGLPLTAEASQGVLDALTTLREPVKVSAANTLRAGAEAEGLIRTVQQSLERQGYRAGSADGRMGEATATAIRAFERDHGLAMSGRVTAALLVKLADTAKVGRVANAREQ